METPRYDIVIIGGFGHVGLPLGIVLADSGLQVALYDINAKMRPVIESGEMPFIEYGADPILKKVIGKSLHVRDDLAVVSESKIVLITIGTPVDEYLSPKTRPLFELADALVPHLHDGHSIILRSTVYPGTSTALHQHFAAKGLKVNLAYCPERIVQGYAIQELKTLPQIISGTSPEAITMAKELFEKMSVETIETETEEAELTKLYLNAWRYIQFAVGNQFYMMAQDRGLDYGRIYHAMTHHYDRGDLPGPGFAAGPCLLKDTMQLAASYRNQFPLGNSAMMINEGLPAFVVDHLIKDNGPIRGKKVGILGMAFKANIDDTRDSLSFKLLKLLRFHGAEVVCSDEFAPDASFVSKDDLISSCDIVIVGVPHKAYKELQVPAGKTVVDLWNVLPRRS